MPADTGSIEQLAEASRQAQARHRKPPSAAAAASAWAATAGWAVLLAVLAWPLLRGHLPHVRSFAVVPVRFRPYGVTVGVILLAKLALSLAPKRKQNRRVLGEPLRPAVVVTVFNEDPDVLSRCLASICAQEPPPLAVTVVDDCSQDEAAIAVALEWAPAMSRRAGYVVMAHARNRGKRQALATGFRRTPDAEAYVCIDSDTVLEPGALAAVVEPLRDPRVHCSTGLVMALNRTDNLLTRLTDMRYASAMLGERAAYSRFGAMLCACGSIAAYRGWVVRKHLRDFLTQRFLGRRCTFGDDRRLTYYCLTEGKAVIEPAAVARTLVPSGMRKYLRQQARWTRSFLRESVLMVLHGPRRKACWWLSLLELVTWSAFTGALIYAVTMARFGGTGYALAGYLAYVAAMSYLRSVHYLRARTGLRLSARGGTYLLAPLYAVMNVVLLIPLRLWCLATLARTSWGTRALHAGGTQ